MQIFSNAKYVVELEIKLGILITLGMYLYQIKSNANFVVLHALLFDEKSYFVVFISGEKIHISTYCVKITAYSVNL